jgi:hypothetical protein
MGDYLTGWFLFSSSGMLSSRNISENFSTNSGLSFMGKSLLLVSPYYYT